MDQPACFEAIVISHPRTAHIRQGLDLTKVTLADQTARLSVTFFNQRYIADHLLYGQSYIFYGKLEGDARGVQMTNPVFEPVESSGVLTRRILPLYSLTAGITNKFWSKPSERPSISAGQSAGGAAAPGAAAVPSV